MSKPSQTENVCPDVRALTKLSCVHDQTFVRSSALSYFNVQTFVRFSVFPDYVNLDARHPRCEFIWVWTYRISAWDLNLGGHTIPWREWTLFKKTDRMATCMLQGLPPQLRDPVRRSTLWLWYHSQFHTQLKFQKSPLHPRWGWPDSLKSQHKTVF